MPRLEFDVNRAAVPLTRNSEEPVSSWRMTSTVPPSGGSVMATRGESSQTARMSNPIRKGISAMSARKPILRRPVSAFLTGHILMRPSTPAMSVTIEVRMPRTLCVQWTNVSKDTS
jgi:hypothetical protein